MMLNISFWDRMTLGINHSKNLTYLCQKPKQKATKKAKSTHNQSLLKKEIFSEQQAAFYKSIHMPKPSSVS